MLSRDLDKREHLMIHVILIETLCCYPSSEPSHGEGPDEGSKHMFYMLI